jgi:flagellar motor switch protein FliM
MNPILSQDEVNALLKGVQAGDIDTESAKKKAVSDVRHYDLSSQERIAIGRMHGLKLANERFARFFRNSVFTLIMKSVDISTHNVEIIKFGEFMETISFPSSINIFKMEPLKGYALFVIEAQLVFAFVEFFFGGSSTQHVKAEVKHFTPIEHGVTKKMVAVALNDLSTAWKEIIPIRPERVGSEINPQLVTIVAPGEIIIKIEMHIKVEDFIGKFSLCIPYSMIEPVKDKFCSVIQAEKVDVDQKWIATLKEIIMDSPVEVTAELGTAEITFGNLMNLDTDSVINLRKSPSDESVIKVEGVPKFRGMPGYSQGNQAIKITIE